MKVFIVTFDDQELAQKYVDANSPDWPVLRDPDRSVYRALGMGSASWWDLIGPAALWKYFKMFCKGTRPQSGGSDLHQLGGDVLIDPEGILRMLYVSEGPHDRPSMEEIFAAIKG